MLLLLVSCTSSNDFTKGKEILEQQKKKAKETKEKLDKFNETKKDENKKPNN